MTESSVHDVEEDQEKQEEDRSATDKPNDPEPLKPYLSKDPRYRSSVQPPQWKRNDPITPPEEEGIPSEDEKTRDHEEIAGAEEVAGEIETIPFTAEATEDAPVVQDAASLETSNAENEKKDKKKADRPAPSGKRAPRMTSKKAELLAAAPHETPEEAQVLWERVPRHVQALIRTQSDEVAQRSYQGFRESRSDLVRRLLDPELTLEETARIIGVCPTTVRRYTNRGLLSHHRTPGNQRRFRLSHVLEFMERFGGTLSESEENCESEGESANGSPANPHEDFVHSGQNTALTASTGPAS